MALSCRQPNHVPHIWPALPLARNHMILPCEQICQWCPDAAKNSKHVNQRWNTATNLRKHAKCHIANDSAFTIQAAGKGGRTPIVLQNHFVDSAALYQTRVQEAGTVVVDQSPTRDRPVATHEPAAHSRNASVQSSTGKQSVVEHHPAAPIVELGPDAVAQLSTSQPLVAEHKPAELLLDAAIQLSTSEQPVVEHVPVAEIADQIPFSSPLSSSSSTILNSNLLLTSEVLETPGFHMGEFVGLPVSESTINDTTVDVQTTTRTLPVINRSIYDPPESSPDSSAAEGSKPNVKKKPNQNQSSTSSLVPSRRMRSHTLSQASLPVRRSKRTK